MGERTIELRPGESLTFADGTRVFVRAADGEQEQSTGWPPIPRIWRFVGEQGPELETTAPSKRQAAEIRTLPELRDVVVALQEQADEKIDLLGELISIREQMLALTESVLNGGSAGASIPADEVPTLADVLEELRASRALLERQTAVLAWSQLLQRDPFSPSPLDPEQAAQEAHSTALAARSTASGLDLARVDSLSPSVRTPGSPSVGSAQEARE
ncbi:hypothetical protein [Xenophilus sp. Marseille-Q4582]|uniref:hypothetical protein n=1 Tax=Xenophilus sp. Marseille-Q4582 TaxID=2866600 RepID=UPI001CE3DC24|nr:hypothetical protein [Xenophilus sp. Marseille-Q4582]